MDAGEENSQKLQELQALEQNLQSILYQKQSFQSELNEAGNAFDEVKKAKEDPYKIISGVMLKTPKDDVLKELENKKNHLGIRIDAIEKQEKLLHKRSTELKESFSKSLESQSKVKK